MAYLVANNAIIEITFEGVHVDQQVMTVLHYKVAGTTIQDGRARIQQLLLQMDSPGGLCDAWRNCISEEVDGMTLSGQWIYPTRFAYSVRVPAQRSGTEAGPAFPTNVAAAITRRGEQAGRHHVGTIHMPGVPRDGFEVSEIQAPYFDKLANFADKSLNTIIDTVTGNEYNPVLYNRLFPSFSSSPIEATVQTFARTMHRRTVGLGS